ncbi:4-hydroxyphenylacetate decarboxylase activase [Oceanirhabdus seepicola]|uniref:4-hydroxyphenylacetate decarboxylase activase n=1 Tax=Oceanirhabdus seepicola TaxID=2828781 RepID=A0A9J6P458_9CLOT|nr:4-hydroxyphenylacetate decarboxylase activase [Oceanirhabdus seepicola]MCM1990849.1 4-hydroxyphenylacetate decarboxylase activase [Oceanirhabdus seepicola]
MDLKGNIFDIQGFSVHDGPGSRTTVFLKGCPLKCEWCANPESWITSQEIMYRKFKCKSCGNCLESCNLSAISIDNGVLKFNKELCSNCTSFECADSCYNDAIDVIGDEYTVDALMDRLQRDRDSWGPEGGVTFSGGEPLMQHEFLLEVLKKCNEEYIHTAIETTALVSTDIFMTIMEYIDFAFIDVKHFNEASHINKTGVSNKLILANIKTLVNSNWSGELILRMPVIEGFNDTEENISALIDFMKENSLSEINILPFHRMGESKWNGIGKDYSYSSFEATSEETLLYIKNRFTHAGLQCYIGSDTPF